MRGNRYDQCVGKLGVLDHVARSSAAIEIPIPKVDLDEGIIRMADYYRNRFEADALGDFPVCDDIFARALTLPLYEGMTVDEQKTVVDELHASLSVSLTA